MYLMKKCNEREREGERATLYMYMYNMTFVKSLFFWNFCECNVYCSFLLFISLLYIIYFTCFGNVNSHAKKAP